MLSQLSQSSISQIRECLVFLNIHPCPGRDGFVNPKLTKYLKIALAFFQVDIPLKLTEDQFVGKLALLYRKLGKYTIKEVDPLFDDLSAFDMHLRRMKARKNRKKKARKPSRTG